VRIMEKYRDVDAYKIKYQHMASVATKEHRDKSEEFLVVGRPKTKVHFTQEPKKKDLLH
jgi:hypothetical protein